MVGIKRMILPMTAVAALALLPATKASAVGPFLALPWLLGHPIAALAALADTSCGREFAAELCQRAVSSGTSLCAGIP
jgi:hypothetical protein